MQKKMITAVGALLVAASLAQIAPTFARTFHQVPANSGETFRHAYNSADDAAPFCSTEPGNPYNPQTDYMGWSAWRAHGAWDNHNDC